VYLIITNLMFDVRNLKITVKCLKVQNMYLAFFIILSHLHVRMGSFVRHLSLMQHALLSSLEFIMTASLRHPIYYPKRVVHSLNVGMALALVSLLYLMEPLFNGIGKMLGGLS